MGTCEGWFWSAESCWTWPLLPPPCNAEPPKERRTAQVCPPRQLPARASTSALLGAHSQSHVIPTEAGPLSWRCELTQHEGAPPSDCQQ